MNAPRACDVRGFVLSDQLENIKSRKNISRGEKKPGRRLWQNTTHLKKSVYRNWKNKRRGHFNDYALLFIYRYRTACMRLLLQVEAG